MSCGRATLNNFNVLRGNSMNKRDSLTIRRLHEALNYNPETGLFTWAQKRLGVRFGQEAGTISRGYRMICLDRVDYMAHRLAWLHCYGVWPDGDVDHINQITLDNRLCNLRDLPHRHNLENQTAVHANRKAGTMLGATWDASRQKWRAVISLNGKQKHLGRFETEAAAFAAYVDAKRAMHVGNTL